MKTANTNTSISVTPSYTITEQQTKRCYVKIGSNIYLCQRELLNQAIDCSDTVSMKKIIGRMKIEGKKIAIEAEFNSSAMDETQDIELDLPF